MIVMPSFVRPLVRGGLSMQKLTLNAFITVCSLFIFSEGWAFDLKLNFQGFVSIKTKDLYVNYTAPEKNKEIVLLLNFLTYSKTQ